MRLFTTTNKNPVITTKQVIVELYSSDETNVEALNHELLSNNEVGAGLRKTVNQLKPAC